MVIDQAGLQTDPPVASGGILGARWAISTDADPATAQSGDELGADLFTKHFDCLGRNRFRGWDVSSSSTVTIEPSYGNQ